MSELVHTPASVGSAAGGWGIEARHRWDDVITLNDRSQSPQYRVRRIGGLRGLGDSEDNREPRLGRDGEIPRQSYRRGKTVTYEKASIIASSLAELRQAEEALAAAFADVQTEKRMVIAPHPDYASGSRFYWARSLSCEIADEQEDRSRYRREFVVAVRMSDPRIFDSQPESATTAAVGSSGGTSLPFTLPVELEASGSVSGAVVIENPGTAPADPVIDVYGPVSDPVVENATYSVKLAFTNLVLTAEQFVRIDFGRPRRVLLMGEAGADYSSRLDVATSDWWAPTEPGLRPGEQMIRLSGESLGDPARAEISFNAAYW